MEKEPFVINEETRIIARFGDASVIISNEVDRLQHDTEVCVVDRYRKLIYYAQKWENVVRFSPFFERCEP